MWIITGQNANISLRLSGPNQEPTSFLLLQFVYAISSVKKTTKWKKNEIGQKEQEEKEENIENPRSWQIWLFK